MRLDRALAEELEGVHSRSSLARLIREGRVRLGGRLAKPAAEVHGGEVVVLEIPDPAPSDLEAEDLAVPILYEDSWLAVVEKPPGMVTHPAGRRRTGTLVNALLHQVKDLSGIGGVLRPGIVHRLDEGTSGLLVVAKNDEAHRRLAAQLKERTLRRTYEALAWGRVEPTRFEIAAPIGRHPRDRKRMAVVPGGKEALSRVRVLRAGDLATHVEVTLATGRTHQIRVHLSHRGHPIVGDPRYGGRRRALRRLPKSAEPAARRLLDSLSRPALHAVRLELRHPASGEVLGFASPLPQDIRTALALAFPAAR